MRERESINERKCINERESKCIVITEWNHIVDYSSYQDDIVTSWASMPRQDIFDKQ